MVDSRNPAYRATLTFLCPLSGRKPTSSGAMLTLVQPSALSQLRLRAGAIMALNSVTALYHAVRKSLDSQQFQRLVAVAPGD